LWKTGVVPTSRGTERESLPDGFTSPKITSAMARPSKVGEHWKKGDHKKLVPPYSPG